MKIWVMQKSLTKKILNIIYVTTDVTTVSSLCQKCSFDSLEINKYYKYYIMNEKESMISL